MSFKRIILLVASVLCVAGCQKSKKNDETPATKTTQVLEVEVLSAHAFIYKFYSIGVQFWTGDRKVPVVRFLDAADNKEYVPFFEEIGTSFKEGTKYRVKLLRSIYDPDEKMADDEKVTYELQEILSETAEPLAPLEVMEISSESQACTIDGKKLDKCQLRRIGDAAFGLDVALWWFSENALPEKLSVRASSLKSEVNGKEVPVYFVESVIEAKGGE